MSKWFKWFKWFTWGNSIIKSREQCECNRFSKSLFPCDKWGCGVTVTRKHKVTRYQGSNRCVGNKVNVSLQSSCLYDLAVQVYRDVTISPISPYHTITQCPLISMHREHTVSRFTRYHGRHNCKGVYD